MKRTYIIGEDLKTGQVVIVKDGVVYKARDEDIQESVNLESQIQALAQLVNDKIAPKRTKDGVVHVNPESEKHIKARLHEYTFDELKQAIEKFSHNKWRMTNNSSKPLWWYFRSRAQVDTFLALEEDMIPQLEGFRVGGKIYTLTQLEEAEKKGEVYYDRGAGKFFPSNKG